MKIVIYDKNNDSVKAVYEKINNPVFDGNTVYFDKGAIMGFDDSYIFIDDNDTIPKTYKEAKIADKKNKINNKNNNPSQMDLLLALLVNKKIITQQESDTITQNKAK